MPVTIFRLESEPLRSSAPGVADLGRCDLEEAETAQVCQPGQTRIGDLGSVQSENDEVGHPIEVLESGVGDPGVTQVQPSQLHQAFDVAEPGVGHRCATELQVPQTLEPADDRQVIVRDRLAAEGYRDCRSLLEQEAVLTSETLDQGDRFRIGGPGVTRRGRGRYQQRCQ